MILPRLGAARVATVTHAQLKKEFKALAEPAPPNLAAKGITHGRNNEGYARRPGDR